MSFIENSMTPKLEEVLDQNIFNDKKFGDYFIRGDQNFTFIRNETLSEIFAQTVEKFPNKIALIFKDKNLTYSQLNDKANCVAKNLHKIGVREGDIIGLWLPRGLDLLILQLGIIKSGAAFLPFDSEAPFERISICMNSSNGKLLLTDEDWIERCNNLKQKTLGHLAVQQKLENYFIPTRNSDPSQIAYIIYTSGSTGIPKGIMISQKNICHLLRSENDVFKIKSDDKVYQGFSLAFDMSFEEIWISYLVGATLWIAPKELSVDPINLPIILEQEKITVLHIVPTLLALFTHKISSLRIINLGGEACPPNLAEKWIHENCKVYNSYGPTETTVTATIEELIPNKKITIGKPIPNYGMCVIDESNNVLPFNNTGELCIFGPGVSLGYLANKELTKQKFIDNPSAKNENEKILYRSGDLAFIDENENIHFLGRIDDQVKIRGFRIELGEIESTLQKIPNIAAAAVVLIRENDIERLVAYLVSNNKNSYNSSELRQLLQRNLPTYMIPNSFIWLSEMPRLSSGKIDRKELKNKPLLHAEDDIRNFQPKTKGQEVLLNVLLKIFPNQSIQLQYDFFTDLGGHSLLAAKLISELRKTDGLAKISIHKIYEFRIISKLAEYLEEILQQKQPEKFLKDKVINKYRASHRYICGLIQGILLPFLIILRVLNWLLPFFAFHYMTGDHEDSIVLAISASLVTFIITQLLTFLIVIFFSRIILYKIKPGKYPLWGKTYLRWWIVDKLYHVAPVYLLYGSINYSLYLKLLGAKIGKNVILSSANLRFPKFISLGNRVSIGSSASLENARVENNELILGSISIEESSSIAAYCVVEGNTVIKKNSYLSGLSGLCEGSIIKSNEFWDGSPAKKIKNYNSPEPPKDSNLFQRMNSYFVYGIGSITISILFFLPIFPTFVLIDEFDNFGFWQRTASQSLLEIVLKYFILVFIASSLLILFTGLFIGFIRSFLIPKLKPGIYSIYSYSYFIRWIVNQFQESSLNVFQGIFATIYAPFWFKILRAKIGKKAEISNVMGIVPEFLDLGDETFIADAVMLGSSELNNGWMYLNNTKISNRSFVGNGAYVPSGTHLPENMLIGVQSKPPENHLMNTGDTWMGSPPLLLPARETFSGFPDSLTFDPSFYRIFCRGIVEAFRIILPFVITITSAYLIINYAMPLSPIHTFVYWFEVLFDLSFASFIYGISTFFIVFILKWISIGRYKPRSAPMWSFFIWRTEAITSIYESICVPNFLNFLRGTPWISFFLRLLGCKIGKNSFIDTTNITEFDCVKIGDHCVLNNRCGPQTHLFEDRIMKVGIVNIESNVTLHSRCTVLYNANIGQGARLGPLTLVLKGESIPENTEWIGVPAQPWNVFV
ncbi:Pls/PosA family non-ribosomal peptide synthetase [Pigmentibacter ruber]